jgi:hypothetical protein
MSALAAWAGLGSKRGAAAPSGARTIEPRNASFAFDVALLGSLAEVVLPSVLGRDGAARAARNFSAWMDGHEEAAELLHPYGSSEIAFASALPIDTWSKQLAALDQDARRAHGKRFVALGSGERSAIVRAALEGTRITGMPAARSAPHVAIAVASHYFGTPEATDLCYDAQIRKNQCRPLVNASRKPLPLARSGT